MDKFLLKALIILVTLTLFVNVYFILGLNDQAEREQYLGAIFSKEAQSESIPNGSPTANVNDNSNDDDDPDSNSVSTATSGSESAPDCYSRFGMSSKTVIFYYESNETHSMNMKSIVDSISSNRIYPMNQLWNASFNQCFSLSGTVPTFVCAGSKSRVSGEMSQTVLEAFMASC